MIFGWRAWTRKYATRQETEGGETELHSRGNVINVEKIIKFLA